MGACLVDLLVFWDAAHTLGLGTGDGARPVTGPGLGKCRRFDSSLPIRFGMGNRRCAVRIGVEVCWTRAELRDCDGTHGGRRISRAFDLTAQAGIADTARTFDCRRSGTHSAWRCLFLVGRVPEDEGSQPFGSTRPGTTEAPFRTWADRCYLVWGALADVELELRLRQASGGTCCAKWSGSAFRTQHHLGGGAFSRIHRKCCLLFLPDREESIHQAAVETPQGIWCRPDHGVTVVGRLHLLWDRRLEPG